jgi:ferredoxin
VHVQRLGRPETAPPRLLAGAMLAVLLALALVAPVTSEARWEAHAHPATLALDWFLLFAHPLMYATSPATLWAFALGATAALAALPYLKPLKTTAARVDPANCNGCGRCVADCPFNALELREKAHVFPERCAACGICAGACPSSTPFRKVADLVSGIDLPDLTVHDLRRSLQANLPADEVVFRCEKRGAGGIALPCIAMLPPSFIEYALRNGARRVRTIACREGECAYRLGPALARERFAGEREPHLRRTVRHESHDDEHWFSYR